MKQPTEIQKAILQFIASYEADYGSPPSHQTIAENIIGANNNPLTVPGVSQHIRAMVTKGYLRKRDIRGRSIELTSEGREVSDAV